MSIKTIFKNAVLVMALMCLTFVTAWAQTRATKTVTKTVTWDMDGGKSGTTIKQDEYSLYTTAGGSLHWDCSDPEVNTIRLSYWPSFQQVGTTSLQGNVLLYGGTATLSDIEGKVTKVEISNIMFAPYEASMYVGKNRIDVSTLLHIEGTTDDYDYPSTENRNYNSVTFVGEVDVDKNNPLKIIFYGIPQSEMDIAEVSFMGGYIAVTYEVEEELTGDPGHTFSFSTNGNHLTATCNQTDANHICELMQRKATLTLTANDAAFDGKTYFATLNTQEFVDATGITNITTTFSYENKSTHEIRTTGVNGVGEYTVTAIVTINGTNYTLSKDFIINDKYFSIANNSPQLSLNTTSCRAGEEVIIWVVDPTFEIVTVSVIGATANLTLENKGIRYTEQDKLYHFYMPNEDVTISATLIAPITINSNNGGSVTASVGENTNVTKAQSGETVTLSATPDEGYTVTKVHVYNGNKTYNVIDNGDGTFSFTMPASAVTVEVEFSKTIGALTISYFGDRTTATINGNYTADDALLTLAEDITVTSVTFDRTFTPGATSTIILPFAVESGNYEGGTFYEFTSVDYKNDKWVASLTKVAGNIEAHKPYLYMPSDDKLTIKSGVTFNATSAEEYKDEKGDWTFKGVFKKKDWETGVRTDYFFASTSATSTEGNAVNAGDFVRIGNECHLSPFRCYLSYSVSGSEQSLLKSAKELPSSIEVRLIDEVASVVEPDDNPSESGEVITPVSEITPNSGIKVWSFDGTIFIEAQSNMDYTIVDLNGRTLKNGVTNSTREEVTLNRAAGIVIVKIGNKTFKVQY